MITVEHLTKCYGDFTAVHDLSFEIGEGHIYGFLGPNGAGKTTTMNIMTGCLSATEGTVKIDGFDIFEEADQAKRRIGYLPEQPPLYLNETPSEYLHFVGEAKGLKGASLEEQVEEVMARTGITEMRNRRISALSKGYKQRVGIAQALLGDPKVIILDEPTVGLDPIQIIEIRELVKELGQTHTVIFSSHILSEVQAICDEILIIAHGKLLAIGTPAELTQQFLTPSEISLTAAAGREEAEAVLAEVPDIAESVWSDEADGYVSAQIRISAPQIYEVSKAIFSAFAGHGIALAELALKRADLEDVFLELTEGGESSPQDTEETQSPAEVSEESESESSAEFLGETKEEVFLDFSTKSPEKPLRESPVKTESAEQETPARSEEKETEESEVTGE